MIFYRAMPPNENLRINDYITPSKNFAIDHAITTSIYNEEDYAVYQFNIEPHQFKTALNPGEFILLDIPTKHTLVGIATYNPNYATSDFKIKKQASTYHEHWQEHDIQKHMQWLSDAKYTKNHLFDIKLEDLIKQNIKTLNEITKAFGLPAECLTTGANQDVFKTTKNYKNYIVKLDPKHSTNISGIYTEGLSDVMTHFKSHLYIDDISIPIYVQEYINTKLSEEQLSAIEILITAIEILITAMEMDIEDYVEEQLDPLYITEQIYKNKYLSNSLVTISEIPDLHPRWLEIFIKSIIKLYQSKQMDFHVYNLGIRKSGQYNVIVFFDA